MKREALLILFVLAFGVYMFSTWHIDLVGFGYNSNIIHNEMLLCNSTINITAYSKILPDESPGPTNGFWEFSDMQVYHLALYAQIIAVVFMLITGLVMGFDWIKGED